MKIILSPTAALTDDTPPTVSGELIIYRGEQYDLSQLPDGAEVEAELPFIGKIKRVAGQVELTLQYQYDMVSTEDNQSTNWVDYTFIVTEGRCPCPIVRKPEPEPIPDIVEVDTPELEEIEDGNSN